jgi:hypothetical protein
MYTHIYVYYNLLYIYIYNIYYIYIILYIIYVYSHLCNRREQNGISIYLAINLILRLNSSFYNSCILMSIKYLVMLSKQIPNFPRFCE